MTHVRVATRSCSSAPRATSPTSRSSRRCTRMVRRGHLDVPVVGVARAGLELDAAPGPGHATASSEHGGVDRGGVRELARPAALRRAATTTTRPRSPRLREALGGAQRPLHYLAIPPSLFATVVDRAGAVRLRRAARGWCVEKPFGRDLASARGAQRDAARSLPRGAIFRIDHYLGKEPVQNLLYFRFANTFLEPIWNRQLRRERADHDGGELRRRRAAAASTRRPARSATWCRTTCCRSSACWPWSRRRGHAPRRSATRRRRRFEADPPARARRTSSAASSAATATRRASRPTRTSRPSRPCGCTSTPGAGPACRSTSAPASACR